MKRRYLKNEMEVMMMAMDGEDGGF